MEVNVRPPLFDKHFWKNYFTAQTFQYYLELCQGDVEKAVDMAEKAADKLAVKLAKAKSNE